MALEATHIRFALDLKDKYQVSDLEKYVSGTIYPDSRYVTGIDRQLTHPRDFLEYDFFKLDDFKKGWFVHLICDKIQEDIMKELIPKAFEGELGQGTDVWVNITAIKILQDIDDVRKFDISNYLPYLSYAQNPNGEDLVKIRKYNNIFVKMYNHPGAVDIDSCYLMWKDFGIGEDLAKKVKVKAEEYQRDKWTMESILKIYDELITRGLKI